MDIGKLMKQAKEMQTTLKKVDEELNNQEYAGNHSDIVSCIIKGDNEVVSIDIKEEMLDKENKEVLQDMICLAINDAVAKARKDRENKMGTLTGGVSMPGIR